MSNSPFTAEEVAILYRHGTQGFIYNAERAAQKKAIEEWKSDPQKQEQLRAFNEVFSMDDVPLDSGLVGDTTSPLDPGLAFNETMFEVAEMSPFDGPGIELKRIGDQLATDVLRHFEQELTRLLENSTLSKQQFLVFVLLWEDPSEYGTERYLGERGVAAKLDIAVGTVRSHHARAKEKIEKAKFTAGLIDYAATDWDKTVEETKTLLDEML